MTTPGSVTIRTLQADDAAALLAFEIANRAWFEQHIEPRDRAGRRIELRHLLVLPPRGIT
ncbi:hypothetical protein ACFFTM_11055 [Pseudoduganella plicata]|uniref:GNAT family N-acetyltransferase n=1 Tax=Pseudoduganella plicata TaxID=321984 RepID=A0A4P7BF80_9BURK|nr:hypothetical protein [Pseudoduganella plicata]QBQ36019.1 hypothetical protein E1742_07545 [Pseudoduganella plicata]GGY78695.1 hypothetical protein GCM10007388_09570 [Pseudoduganella plicata]